MHKNRMYDVLKTHQNALINVDFSLISLCDIHMRKVPYESERFCIISFKIMSLNWLPQLPGDN